MSFEKALAFTLRWEGGWVHHKSDPGGETNYGITKRVAVEHGYTGDMRTIPLELVHRIYRRSYWDKVRGDDLPWPVSFAVFDFAVNSGPARAAKTLQTAVNAMPDGAIGPATLGKVATFDARALARDVCAMRLRFLMTLPTWATFGKGWGRRVRDLEANL